MNHISRLRFCGPLAVVVVAIALAGCGSSPAPPDDTATAKQTSSPAPPDDTALVKQTMLGEFTDFAHGDGAAACARMTPDQQRQLADGWMKGATCPDAVKGSSDNLPDEIRQGMLTAIVNKVIINGNSATIADSDITSSQGDLSKFLAGPKPTEFAKQSDGSWLLSG